MRLNVFYQVKHRCGHTSACQGLQVNRFRDIKDKDMEANIARLESLPCRKCWIKENGYEATGTFCVEIPAGL